jgi:hypothetical protein
MLADCNESIRVKTYLLVSWQRDVDDSLMVNCCYAGAGGWVRASWLLVCVIGWVVQVDHLERG